MNHSCEDHYSIYVYIRVISMCVDWLTGSIDDLLIYWLSNWVSDRLFDWFVIEFHTIIKRMWPIKRATGTPMKLFKAYWFQNKEKQCIIYLRYVTVVSAKRLSVTFVSNSMNVNDPNIALYRFYLRRCFFYTIITAFSFLASLLCNCSLLKVNIWTTFVWSGEWS